MALRSSRWLCASHRASSLCTPGTPIGITSTPPPLHCSHVHQHQDARKSRTHTPHRSSAARLRLCRSTPPSSAAVLTLACSVLQRSCTASDHFSGLLRREHTCVAWCAQACRRRILRRARREERKGRNHTAKRKTGARRHQVRHTKRTHTANHTALMRIHHARMPRASVVGDHPSR